MKKHIEVISLSDKAGKKYYCLIDKRTDEIVIGAAEYTQEIKNVCHMLNAGMTRNNRPNMKTAAYAIAISM